MRGARATLNHDLPRNDRGGSSRSPVAVENDRDGRFRAFRIDERRTRSLERDPYRFCLMQIHGHCVPWYAAFARGGGGRALIVSDAVRDGIIVAAIASR